MCYMFIKMSRKWHGAEFHFEFDDDIENMQIHIDRGDIVAFSDSVKGFVDKMGITNDDIEMIL